MMLSDIQIEQRRAAGRKGGAAVVAKYGHKHMRKLGRKGGAVMAQRPADQSAAGKLGWAALCAKDPYRAAQVLADWRSKNSSRIEIIVDGWLAEIGIVPCKEVRLHNLYLDRVVGVLAIEIDGKNLHNDRRPHPECQDNDRRKEALCFSIGYTLIRISERDILNGSAKETLHSALHLPQYRGIK